MKAKLNTSFYMFITHSLFSDNALSLNNILITHKAYNTFTNFILNISLV